VGKLLKTLGAIAAFVAAGAAQAGLVLALEGRDIDGRPVAANAATAVFEYDPNLNITWLRDWSVRGAASWPVAMDWASGLTVGAFSGWMLPTFDASDTSCSNTTTPPGFPAQHFGFNCTGNVMGYLWYEELGNTAGSLTNSGPFQNVEHLGYWSSTEYAADPSLHWFFNPDNGFERLGVASDGPLYVVAIRPGDVAAVAEPATLALVSAALAGVAAARRRKRNISH
jgi:hypothetical protein